MEKRSRLPNDPFHASGELWLHRYLLEHYIKRPSRDGGLLAVSLPATGVWETGYIEDMHNAAAQDNRRDNFRLVWEQGFY